MRFPVHHCSISQDSTVGHDPPRRRRIIGTGGTLYVIPGPLTQYIGHHDTTQGAMPAYGYAIPALTWAPQPAPPFHSAQIDMIPQADPGAVQCGSVIPKLATDISTLKIGNGLYVAGPHPGYPGAAPKT